MNQNKIGVTLSGDLELSVAGKICRKFATIMIITCSSYLFLLDIDS